jgi:hypothetical protein
MEIAFELYPLKRGAAPRRHNRAVAGESTIAKRGGIDPFLREFLRKFVKSTPKPPRFFTPFRPPPPPSEEPQPDRATKAVERMDDAVKTSDPNPNRP